MRSRWIGFVLVSTLSSACSQSVIRDFPTTSFSPIEYGTQASRGTIPVTVLGNVGGLDGMHLSDAVVSQMQGADWPPHARFAAAARPDRNDMYSYVLMFNGPRDVTSSELCARRSGTVPPMSMVPGDAGVVLVAGLCRYDKVASGVTARSTKIAAADDSEFRKFVASTVHELTRPETGFRNDGGMGDRGGRS
jgi:hypothetical protein